MLYEFKLTIPSNTPKSSPLRERVELTRGVIHKVELEFPPGCLGLVHVIIRHFEHQIFPTNRDGDFASDNHVISFPEYYELAYPPYVLTLEGWNEDDTYSHTVTVRIGVLPDWVVQPERGLLNLLRKFQRRFRL